MPLTDTLIRSLKPTPRPSKRSDGGGLYLLVTPQGSKLWRLAYRFANKQKTLAFGAYPDVSLADARERRDQAKKLLASGIDPAQQARQEKLRQRYAHSDTFEKVADEFVQKLRREGKAEATISKKEWLLGMASRELGKRPVSEVTASEILAPLRRVERRGTYETAHRMRAVVG